MFQNPLTRFFIFIINCCSYTPVFLSDYLWPKMQFDSSFLWLICCSTPRGSITNIAQRGRSSSTTPSFVHKMSSNTTTPMQPKTSTGRSEIAPPGFILGNRSKSPSRDNNNESHDFLDGAKSHPNLVNTIEIYFACGQIRMSMSQKFPNKYLLRILTNFFKRKKNVPSWKLIDCA